MPLSAISGTAVGWSVPIVFGALVLSPTLRRAFAVFAAALFPIGLLMAVIPDQGVRALGSMMAMFAVLVGFVWAGAVFVGLCDQSGRAGSSTRLRLAATFGLLPERPQLNRPGLRRGKRRQYIGRT